MGCNLPQRTFFMRRWGALFVVACLLVAGCREQYRQDLDYSYGVEQTWPIDELPGEAFVQFESVFWEPDDTISLRKLIKDKGIANGRDVLEIGTGTGLIAILCLANSAKSVVATDINNAAVANAAYNAAMLYPDKSLDVRQVDANSPGAFTVINENEKFDLVISNPPWEDGVVTKPADHAFYDPSFRLMDTLLDGLPGHLKPGGRCLLVFGNVQAIKRLESESEKRGFAVKVLDDRDLDSLSDNFLPGMLLEVCPVMVGQKVQNGEFKPADEVNPEAGPVEAGKSIRGESTLLEASHAEGGAST
ncbi:methyltransferase [Rhodopirellula sp.]|nr:methyltransferase [Rhodopirellula sp.]